MYADGINPTEDLDLGPIGESNPLANPNVPNEPLNAATLYFRAASNVSGTRVNLNEKIVSLRGWMSNLERSYQGGFNGDALTYDLRQVIASAQMALTAAHGVETAEAVRDELKELL
jgi:hypothetical protein